MHSNDIRKVFRRRPRIARLGLVAASALVAGWLVSGAAVAGELFAPVTAGELNSARQSAPKSAIDPARQSFVKLDRAELAAHMAPLGSDREPGRARQARGLDGLIDMTLAPGVTVTLKRTELDRVRGGGYIWTGDVLGISGATASFLIEAGEILGTVHLGDRIFKIEPMTGALHRITEFDPRDVPGDIAVPVPAGLEGAAPAGSAPDLVATRGKRRTKITYLVAYTARARAASANIAQEIKFATAWSNQAFKKSGAKIKFKLVKTMLARNYDEGPETVGAFNGNINDLTFGAALAKVRRKRDKKKADLVSLIRDKSPAGGICGIGWVVPNPSPATANFGFSVSGRGICLPSTFPHEAGHNMGLNHDRFTQGGNPPNSEYNFGYVNLLALIRTIMSYDDECQASGTSCMEIQYFSTPRKRFQGNRIGVAAGNPGAADAARKLNENRKRIAAYR